MLIERIRSQVTRVLTQQQPSPTPTTRSQDPSVTFRGATLYVASETRKIRFVLGADSPSLRRRGGRGVRSLWLAQVLKSAHLFPSVSTCPADSGSKYAIRNTQHPTRITHYAVPLALAAAVLLTPCAARAQTPDPNDYRIITQVPRAELDRWLKDEVRRSGGNLENQRYHFVIGFSTGHFGSDPVHAIAMRRLAFSLLNNGLAPGDQVTPLGWEMKLWHTGDRIKLTEDPQTRAAFVDDVPYAPAAGSRGGHDTERALYETLTNVVSKQEAPSTLVLLLTNTNQSQGPTGTRATLFGANNRLLADALKTYNYRQPVRHSFTAQSKSGPLNIDVTALFPRKAEPLPGAPTTARYPGFPVESWQPPADRPAPSETLPNPVQTAAPGQGDATNGTRTSTTTERTVERERRGGFPWLLVIGLLVLAGIIAAVLAMRRKSGAAQGQKSVPAKKGRPLPGSVTAVIGAAPHDTRVPLKGLTTASRWALIQGEDGNPSLREDADPPAAGAGEGSGTRLAAVSWDEKGRMQVQAEGDTSFLELKGINVSASNSRQLNLAPGDRLVCRVASAASARPPVRLEFIYSREG